jgi:hypothetical protein
MLDATEFGKSMAAIVKEAQAPLLKRIEQLEARQPERGVDGVNGKDGSSVTVDDVAPLVAELVTKAVADIPRPKDGADGKDADPIDVKDVVAELLTGDEIKTLVDLHVAEALPATVAKHFEANPVQHGKDGRDGAPGKDGEPGQRGTDGTKGDPGRDGLDVKDLFRADGGRLVAVLSDGTTKDLGEFVGKDGRDGKDGKDGLGFEDCELEVVDGIVTHKFIRGDVVKSISYAIPEFKHIGFWGPAMSAKAGQFTTHDGHLWMAQRDTSETPNYQAKDWQLSARKGADGARGPAGKDFKPHQPTKLKADGDA